MDTAIINLRIGLWWTVGVGWSHQLRHYFLTTIYPQSISEKDKGYELTIQADGVSGSQARRKHSVLKETEERLRPTEYVCCGNSRMVGGSGLTYIGKVCAWGTNQSWKLTVSFSWRATRSSLGNRAGSSREMPKGITWRRKEGVATMPEDHELFWKLCL